MGDTPFLKQSPNINTKIVAFAGIILLLLAVMIISFASSNKKNALSSKASEIRHSYSGANSSSSQSSTVSNTPLLFVQIHTWWNTPARQPEAPGKPSGTPATWGYWAARPGMNPDVLFANSLWPHRMISSLKYPYPVTQNEPSTSLTDFYALTSDNPKKVSNSGSYPYIGLYDSSDREIVRWHIKLAKAAGINAFAVSLNDIYVDTRLKSDGTKICPAAHTPWIGNGLQRFKQYLDIAQEENFKIFAEVWAPEHIKHDPNQCGALESWKESIKQIISYTNHPAYLKLEGKPVISPYYWGASADIDPNGYWTFQVTLNQAVNESKTPINWLVRGWTDGILTYTAHTGSSNVFAVALGKITQAEQLLPYPDYTKQLADISSFKDKHGLERKTVAHIYPRFDDSFAQGQTWYKNKPSFIPAIDANGNSVLTKQLENAKKGGADYIFMESWNDWQEQHMIEPARQVDGVERLDPYEDLKTIAKFKGVSFVPPALPPASSRDKINFLELKKSTIDKTVLHPNETVRVTCDYGTVRNCIFVKTGANAWQSCKYEKMEGTAGVFSCTAPNHPTSFKHACVTLAGTSHYCIPQNDEGVTITVIN